jgi:uncharacterized protein (DUF1697 family)
MPAESFVAFLRGINVGGKHPLPMRELVEIFTAVGGRNVRTYIQSGNVVYQAPAAVAERLARRIERSIRDRFGYDVPVVTRTASELVTVASRNPFLEQGADPERLMVLFLSEPPAARRASGLDPRRSPPDAFVVHGREIYLHCPGGFARSKLTNAYFDAQLGTISTGRNWRTVQKLVQMSTE